MINGLIAMLRKLFGLFVEDGSLALSISVWIFAVHVVMPIAPVEQEWAAPVLFLGCLAILIENVLRASSESLQLVETDRETGTDEGPVRARSVSLSSEPIGPRAASPALHNGGVMNESTVVHSKLARRLVLDELFDLSLYRSVRNVATGDLREILDQLIPIEERHFKFWQDFFDLHVNKLDLARRLKLALIVAVCRLFGAPAIHLVLEAIEVYGVRKYLKVWRIYGHGPLGVAVRSVLEDEFKHEDEVVTGAAERRLNPERVRNIFLGLNDGLVEILGAVSGFFAAFGNSVAVLVAGLTVAVAGALSMAAGAWIAASSESEVRATEDERRGFLGESVSAMETAETPLISAIVVGGSYLAGALLPVLPVLAGARTLFLPLLTAGSLIIIVSMILAFLSGMNIKRRVITNLVIIAAAVGITFAIGLVTKLVWGVSV